MITSSKLRLAVLAIGLAVPTAAFALEAGIREVPPKEIPVPTAGVNCYILTPDSIPEQNRNRLLVHVHGGGYVFAPGEAASREARS